MPRASAPTGTSGGDGDQGSGSSRSSRSSDDDDDDYTHFAALETTRAVAENSAAGSAVGNPVVAQANPGNRVTYYLEGKDAARFDIEPDTGQLLVGEDLVLDREGGPDSYTVVVVADPRRGSTARVTVTINVIDAPETVTMNLAPAGPPAEGQPLTASLARPDGPDGEITVISWQWQRSADGESWQTIAGADSARYTPTEADAGHRLRVIVLYRPPGDDESLTLTGVVTERLPGTAAPAAEAPEARATVTGPPGADDSAPAVEERAVLYLLPLEGVTVGEPVVAALTHPSASLRVMSWQWQRSVDGVHWQVIEEADEGSYVPVAADAGHLLRVIVSYQAPDGGMELAGAATERLPGSPAAPVVEAAPDSTPEARPDTGSDTGSGAAQASAPQAEPAPVPVAAATPVPTAVPTPVPSRVTIPASTAAPEPAVAGTRAPFLESASSLASRGARVGASMDGSRPADESGRATPGSSGPAPESAGMPPGQGAEPSERAATGHGTAATGGQPAAGENSGATRVWVALAVFAVLVVGGGFSYYRLRMRRR